MKAILNFRIYFVLLFTFLLLPTSSALASWAKEGFLLDKSEKGRTHPVVSKKRSIDKTNAVKAKADNPSTEPITFKESDFEKSGLEQLHNKLDALVDIFLSSESLKLNELKVATVKSDIYANTKAQEQSIRKVVKVESAIDKFAQMDPPKLWTVAMLANHPSYKNASIDNLLISKRGQWFIDVFNGDKFMRYLKIAMSMLPVPEALNPETDMVSFNKLCDMRLALIYTLKQCEPGVPILDLGSGYGMMARNMLVLGAHVTLVDYSKLALEKAAKHFKQYQEFLPPNYTTLYRLIKSDINNPKAPYFKNKYWMVLCEQVVHFETPEQIHSLLDRVYGVLYPGGLLFVSVINVFQSQEVVDLYLEGRKQGKEFPLPGCVGPVLSKSIYAIYLALEELEAVIKKHGFIIEVAMNVDIRGEKTDKTCFDISSPGISACVIARRPY